MEGTALLAQLEQTASRAFERYQDHDATCTACRPGVGPCRRLRALERAWHRAEQQLADLELDIEDAAELQRELRVCCFDPAREVRIFTRLAGASRARGDIVRARLQDLEAAGWADILRRARDAGVALRGESR